MTSPTYTKVLVPLDTSDWAERALPHASEIARANNAELVLLHVIQTHTSEYTPQVTLAGMDELSDQNTAQVKAYLQGLRNQLKIEGVKAHYAIVESRKPAETICEFASEEDIDLIVMSTHGRTGLARFLFGSIAHKIMQTVRVPVMLVRPEHAEIRPCRDFSSEAVA